MAKNSETKAPKSANKGKANTSTVKKEKEVKIEATIVPDEIIEAGIKNIDNDNIEQEAKVVNEIEKNLEENKEKLEDKIKEIVKENSEDNGELTKTGAEKISAELEKEKERVMAIKNEMPKMNNRYTNIWNGADYGLL